MHPRDLLGKYVTYRVNPGAASASGGLVNGLLPNQTASVTADIYEGPSPDMAVDTNRKWTFTFLKYCAGAVTFTSLSGGGDVLTGPMTGCYLCKYNRMGPKLAHIGTADSKTSESSTKAKKAWLLFVGRPDVTDVTGGKPDDYFSTAEVKAAMFPGGGIPDIVAYFVGGEAHAMLLAPVPMAAKPPKPNLSKVVAYKKMTLQPWSAIAAMRTFRL